jgi:hypothetical protein
VSNEGFDLRANAAWILIQRLERECGVDFVSLEGGERLHLLFPQNIDPDVMAAIQTTVAQDLPMINTIVSARAAHPEMWPCATSSPAVGWA